MVKSTLLKSGIYYVCQNALPGLWRLQRADMLEPDFSITSTGLVNIDGGHQVAQNYATLDRISGYFMPMSPTALNSHWILSVKIDGAKVAIEMIDAKTGKVWDKTELK